MLQLLNFEKLPDWGRSKSLIQRYEGQPFSITVPSENECIFIGSWINLKRNMFKFVTSHVPNEGLASVSV